MNIQVELVNLEMPEVDTEQGGRLDTADAARMGSGRICLARGWGWIFGAEVLRLKKFTGPSCPHFDCGLHLAVPTNETIPPCRDLSTWGHNFAAPVPFFDLGTMPFCFGSF